MSEPTLDATGEFELIADLTRALPPLPPGWVGPGDDAAVVALPDAAAGRVVVTCDVLVENRHFRRAWSSAEDVGHKAAAQNLADLAAMAAVPLALVVGFGAPGDLPSAWARQLQAGLAAEAARAGAHVVGGDVVASDQVVVSVTALGGVGSAGIVRRAGARIGDVVALSGPVGMSAAGLAVLQRGFTAPRAAVAAHRRPLPDYGAGPAAAAAGAHALIDVSDGLLADLAHVARASGLSIDVEASRLPVPDVVTAVSAALGGRDPLAFVLGGGEDHALAGCFSPDAALPDGWVGVGSVAAARDDGVAVTVDGDVYEGVAGHRHFVGND